MEGVSEKGAKNFHFFLKKVLTGNIVLATMYKCPKGKRESDELKRQPNLENIIV